MRGRTIMVLAMLGTLAACGSADRAKRAAAHAADAVAGSARKAAHAAANAADNVAARADEGTENGSDEASPLANSMVSAASSLVTDDWIGRWRGVEGLNLVIARDRARGPGHYRLTMRYSLDDQGVFEGAASGDTIVFRRPDGVQSLHASNGRETGLKYLAGRKDCLTVKPGEGYCRDGTGR